jgi:cyclopropane fatty-acyl-phospholipid synthase-like methyltransferase
MRDRVRHWLLFNRWYFGKSRPWDTGVSPPELLRHIAAHPPGRALDLGCGTGTNVITLAQHGWRAIGMDFAIKAIAEAKQKAAHENVVVDVRVGDVTRLDGVTGPFDLVLDIGCFHGLPDLGKDAYAARVQPLVATSGTFLLYVQWKVDTSQRTGIQESDLARFAPLTLVRREDGIDTARNRPSSWLIFQNTARG